MDTVAEHELVFRSDLHVVARLQLAVSHMIFFHPHKRRIRIGLAEAVPFTKKRLLMLVFLQTRQQVFPQQTNRFLERLVFGLLLQFFLQSLNGLLQPVSRELRRLAKLQQIRSVVLGILLPSAGEPHEHDVFADGFGDLARRIEALCVGVDDDFGQHFGVITMPAAAGIGGVEQGVAQTFTA